MKHCPRCNRVYTDQTVNFCLSDGTFLLEGPAPVPVEKPPARRAQEAPTEAMPQAGRTVAPTLPATPQAYSRTAYAPASSSSPGKDSRPLLWVVIGVLLASVAVLSFFLLQKSTDDGRADTRTAAADDTKTANANTPVYATPYATPVLTPSVSQTPTATPTPTPNTASATSEVTAVMNAWEESLRRQDLDGNMRLYADRLDAYYQRGGVSRDQVRASRQAIFDRYYSSTNVQLSNIRVEVDSSGTRATVTYDNSYNWRGGSKYLVGKSHNSMELMKTGTRWLITGERHINTYFEDSGG